MQLLQFMAHMPARCSVETQHGAEHLQHRLQLGIGFRRVDFHDPAATEIDYPVVEQADLAPFASQLKHWFDAANAEAVLVRPDRHVFGTGDPAMLAEEWAALLA